MHAHKHPNVPSDVRNHKSKGYDLEISQGYHTANEEGILASMPANDRKVWRNGRLGSLGVLIDNDVVIIEVRFLTSVSLVFFARSEVLSS